MHPMISAALVGLAALASPAWALDQVLDFSGSICGAAGDAACSDWNEIGQNYGDLAGLLDVSHRSLNAADDTLYEPYLKFWNAGYSDLTNVAWGGADSLNYRGEMSFTPGAGQMVTLNSFDFGDYLDGNHGSTVQIYNGAGTLLWDGGAFNPGATATSFAPAIASTGVLVLRWGPDAYDVGIDNISVSVSAVPEPGTWALGLAGLGIVGAVARRRRA